MRGPCLCSFLALTTLAGGAVSQTPVDPERILSERLKFTSREVAQVKQAQPVVKVNADRDELAVVGAIRLPGTKERLSDWVRNIEHFRRSADLGAAHAVPSPPAAAAFAPLTLDAADLSELRNCTPEKCAIRMSAAALARLQRDVRWGTADAAAQASAVFRDMLLEYTGAYAARGDAAIGADDMRLLLQRAVTFAALAPELAGYLEKFPASTLANVDQLFYWSVMPADAVSIVSLHHLVVYRPRAGEVWVADKSLYASRYFDAGGLVIGMYDAPDGAGFYAVAGSRMRSSQLSGTAATVLRRQIERSAGNSVKMYLEWLRDSLAQAPAA